MVSLYMHQHPPTKLSSVQVEYVHVGSGDTPALGASRLLTRTVNRPLNLIPMFHPHLSILYTRK